MSDIEKLGNEMAEVVLSDGPAVDEQAADPSEFAKLVELMQKDANAEALEDSTSHHALVRMRKALSRGMWRGRVIALLPDCV